VQGPDDVVEDALDCWVWGGESKASRQSPKTAKSSLCLGLHHVQNDQDITGPRASPRWDKGQTELQPKQTKASWAPPPLEWGWGEIRILYRVNHHTCTYFAGELSLGSGLRRRLSGAVGGAKASTMLDMWSCAKVATCGDHPVTRSGGSYEQ
jgi:hypothetical protein